MAGGEGSQGRGISMYRAMKKKRSTDTLGELRAKRSIHVGLW